MRRIPISPLSTSVVPLCDLRTLPEAKGLIDLDSVLVRISWRVFSCSSKSIFSLFWLALSHGPPPTSDNSVVLSQMPRIILPAPLFWFCWCPSLSWCLCLLLALLVFFLSFGIWSPIHLTHLTGFNYLESVPLELAPYLFLESPGFDFHLFQHYFVLSICVIWWQWQPVLEALA